MLTSTILNDIIGAIPLNRSVIVMTSFRTGGTALTNLISKLTNKKQVGELFLDREFVKSTEGLTFINDGKAVGKIESVRIDSHKDFYESALSKCFIIGLYRKDVVQQITSFYVAEKIDKWLYYTDENYSPTYVPIDESEILHACRFIIDANKLLSKFLSDCDAMVFYEDIVNDLNQIPTIKGIKPINYNEILQTVERLINTI
jgi:hypothetical protein